MVCKAARFFHFWKNRTQANFPCGRICCCIDKSNPVGRGNQLRQFRHELLHNDDLHIGASGILRYDSGDVGAHAIVGTQRITAGQQQLASFFVLS